MGQDDSEEWDFEEWNARIEAGRKEVRLLTNELIRGLDGGDRDYRELVRQIIQASEFDKHIEALAVIDVSLILWNAFEEAEYWDFTAYWLQNSSRPAEISKFFALTAVSVEVPKQPANPSVRSSYFTEYMIWLYHNHSMSEAGMAAAYTKFDSARMFLSIGRHGIVEGILRMLYKELGELGDQDYGWAWQVIYNFKFFFDELIGLHEHQGLVEIGSDFLELFPPSARTQG